VDNIKDLSLHFEIVLNEEEETFLEQKYPCFRLADLKER